MAVHSLEQPRDLVGLLRKRATDNPEFRQYCYIPDGEDIAASLTLGELWRRSRAIAARLRREGGEGDRVLLLFPSGLEFPPAFFGCLLAKRLAVPMPPLRPSRLRESLRKLVDIATSAEPGAVLTTAGLHRQVEPLLAEFPLLQGLAWHRVEDIPPALADTWTAPPVAPDDLAFLQYSSGSTRLPKGVMLTHANLLHNIRFFDQGCVHGPDARLLNWLPPFHDHGLVYGLLTPLHVGMPCYVMASASLVQKPSRWMIAASRHRITHSMGPNSMFGLCAESITDAELAGLDLRALRHISNGAEPVRMATMRRFMARFAPCGLSPSAVAPGWGLAEATCIVTETHVGSPDRAAAERRPPREIFVDEAAFAGRRVVAVAPEHPRALSVAGSGFPVPGCVVRVVDPDTREACLPDRVGELWVHSPAVSQGYWNNPEQTAEHFGALIRGEETGPAYLRTGDLGFFEGGEVFVTGRIKDLIIVRGQNHYPQDIEWSVEHAHPLVRPAGAAVFTLAGEDEEWPVAVAEVGRRFQAERDAEALFNAIRAAVAEAHGLQLAAIVLIAPGTARKTTSGKIRRAATREAFLNGELRAWAEWRMPKLREAGQPGGNPPPAPPAAVPARAAAGRLRDWLVARIAALAGVEPNRVRGDIGFGEYGLDSLLTARLAGELQREFGFAELSPTLLFDYPDIDALSAHLASRLGSDAGPGTVAPAPGETLAVVGMACRFPGAADLDAFWNLIRTGGCAVRPLPAARRALLEPWVQNPEALAEAGYLDDIEQFDPAFFHLSPRQAEQLDPQQRLLLMAAWHALEHAGIGREELAGSRTGVFVGLASHDYAQFLLRGGEPLDGHAGPGLANGIAANRISYFLDLKGPSLTLDTACSSSLVAMHLAAASLRRGECDTAIVGGANLLLDPAWSRVFREAGMLSPSGRCHSFDDRADGYVRGEGAGVVILRRAGLAAERGNRVWAELAGSAVNQDGRSFGLTAPNGPAQREVVRAALADAGLAARDLDYVEAHGTGTALGDPIEFGALAEVLDEPGRTRPCRIGSVKANIGHLEAAAGIAGFIKAVLCLAHGEIPPLAGFARPNPRLPSGSALEIPAGTTPMADPRLRHVGITSMGFGGTNAHVILRRAGAPASGFPAEAGTPAPFLVAAESESALRRLAEAAAARLEAKPGSWSALAGASLTGRGRLREHVGFVAGDSGELARCLREFAAGGRAEPRAAPMGEGRLVFAFTGQGTHYPRMGEALYRHYPVFRAAMDECGAALAERHGIRLIDALWGASALDREALRDAPLVQPALVAVEIALGRLLESAGVVPEKVIGHSLGEYAAACHAGAMSPADAMSLTLERARLIGETAGGGMLCVLAGAEAVGGLLESAGLPLDIAAINGRAQTVVAGPAEAVEVLAALCRQRSLAARRLPVARAFHSRLLDPVLDRFREMAARFTFRAPRIPLIGGVEGRPVERCDAEYWTRHLRSPVRFADSVAAAAADGANVFLEIGARPALQSLLGEAGGRSAALFALNEAAPLETLLTALLQLHGLGLPVNWRALGFSPRAASDLPAYPFQLTRHWLAPAARQESSMSQAPESISVPEQPAGAASATAIERLLAGELARLLKRAPESLEPSRPFLEQGADSLILVQLARTVELRYGVALDMGQLFTELPTLQALSAHLAKHAPGMSAPASPEVPAILAAPSLPPVAQGGPPAPASAGLSPLAEGGPAGELMARQLDTFRFLVESQLRTLGHPAAALPGAAVTSPPVSAAPPPAAAAPPEPRRTVATLAAAGTETARLPAEQAAHIAELAKAYRTKTAGSVRYADEYRQVFADYRSSLGFRFPLKELIYPLVVERAEGSRVFDVDGNAYIDLTMAFGASLLGHNPPVIIRALEDQLRNGIQVGPKSPLAGEAARLVAELTGCERVAFANSGTEAVMTALRLARAVTGRTRYARFAGSYHGHSDHTLVRPQPGAREAAPGALGVPEALAREALVLDYGKPEALEVLRAEAGNLAAVLVEPVQSRNPGLQPGEFLKELREITRSAGGALIFDEIITGFRLAPGGAQAHFGVRADLCTYGKIAGGGMPIGVIAGSGRFMDAIDGGVWRYGDDSRPGPVHTFFAGTFSGHPLAMAASIAVLRRMVEAGSALQGSIGAATDRLAGRLNSAFAREHFPIRVHHAGSLFRFVFFDNLSVEFQPIEANLFFYHMILRGVYIWEGHTCFLSEAHSEADLDAIAEAALDSARAMRRGGFFKDPAAVPPAEAPVPAGESAELAERRTAALNGYAVALIAEALGGADSGRWTAVRVVPERERLWRRLRHHLEAAAGSVTPAADARRACLDLGGDPALLSLMERCAAHLPAALAGDGSGAGVLFAGEGREALRRVYREGPGMAAAHRRLAEGLRGIAAPEEGLAVLEIGAGTGGTTSAALPALAGAVAEYLFTDVSPAFFAEAEREFGGRAPFRCGVLDLSRPPEIAAGHDLVIAANVLHALPRVEDALRNASARLKPGGVLALVELEEQHPWLDLVFGQTAGWWSYADDREEGPLLNLGRWTELFDRHGLRLRALAREAGGIGVYLAERAPAEAISVPLGASQRGIALHIGVNEEVSAVYNEPMVFEWRGELDATALERALNAIVTRHDSLRASLSPDGETLRVEPRASVGLGRIDFSLFEPNVAEAKAGEWLCKETRRPFDLGTAPLLRATLVTLGEGRHWLALVGHHLIVDGLSYGVLFEELLGIYRALTGSGAYAGGTPLPLAEANRRQSRIPVEDRAYWLNRLAERPPYLDWPVDRPFPPRQEFAAGRRVGRLPEATARALREFCRSHGLTPFLACLAAYRLLVRRVCNQPEAIIGVPVSVHEPRPGESFIGYGVNVLPLSGSAPGSLSFADFARQTRDDFLAAQRHKRYPLSEAVRELGPERDPSRPALVTTLFNYESVETREGPGYAVGPVIPPAALSKYELALDLIARDDAVDVSLTYAASLFDEATAAKLVERYLGLLAALLADPARALGTHAVLLPEERAVLGYNAPAPMTLDCLHRAFERQAARTPEAPALRYRDQVIGYGELNARANRLARVLRRRRVGPGARVGVCLPRTPDLVVSLFAVLKCGAAYAPLDPAYPRGRLDDLAAAADADLILVADAAAAASWNRGRPLALDELAGERAEASAENPEVAVEPRQLAYLIFTSGSTGRPKGVAIEHATAVSFLDWARSEFDSEVLAGVLASTSVCFDLSVFEIFLPLSVGGTLILMDNALQLTEPGRTDDITLINTVPSAMAELLGAEALPPNLRVVNLAGEALSDALVRRLRELRPEVAVYNLYGPSEDTTYSTVFRMAPGFGGSVTIGKPIAGTRLYLLDEDGLPVPPGTKGMIHLAGNGLARGYFDRPAATAEAFLPDPHAPLAGARMYRTGDIGRRLPSGDIAFLGRRDNQIKLRGHRVELGEIQTLMRETEGVEQAAALVAGRDDDPRLTGFFVVRRGEDPETVRARLAQRLAARLPRYMVPGVLRDLESLPLTPNGKLDTRRLRELAEGPLRDAARTGTTLPRDATEQALAEIWEHHLGVAPVPVDADFFALGGHSLLAIRILHEINSRFGCHLRPSDLLRTPTIERLAECLAGAPREVAAKTGSAARG